MSQRGKKNKKKQHRSNAQQTTKPQVNAEKSPSESTSSGESKGAPRRAATERKLVDAERIELHRAQHRRRTLWYRSLIGAALLIVVAMVGWIVYRSQLPKDIPDNTAKAPANYAVPHGADRTGVAVGSADAQVTVDVFLDYECPHCRDFERKAGDYLNKEVADGTIKLIYHPISILNGYSVWAASAAGCATEQNALPQFTREVYRQDGKLNRDDLVAVGKNIGLNSPQFRDCVQQVRYKHWALGLTEAADYLGVDATPTVLVNGKPIDPKHTASTKSFVSQTKSAIAAAQKVATQKVQPSPAGH